MLRPRELEALEQTGLPQVLVVRATTTTASAAAAAAATSEIAQSL